MAVKFSYYGAMTVLIERSDGYKILCDPYLNNDCNSTHSVSDFYDVDLVLITHTAFDHFGDVIEICENSNCIVCGGVETRRRINAQYKLPNDRWHATIYGDIFKVDEKTTVRTVFAQHNSFDNTEGVNTNWLPFGFVVEVEPGVCYYHTGDTFLYSDMKMIREFYKPNVMCVGVSAISPEYPCELGAREAATAVLWCGVDAVIPTHYPKGSPDLDKFLEYLPYIAPKAKAMPAVGKTFTYHPSWVEE